MPRRRQVVAEEFHMGETVRVISEKSMKCYVNSHGGTCRTGFISSMYKFCDALCEVVNVNKDRRFVCLRIKTYPRALWFDYEMVQKVEEVECYKSEVLDSFLEGVMIE